VRGWSGLVIILIIGAAANMLAAPAYALVPLLVVERLGGQAMDLALIQLAFGIGILIGGLNLSVWGGFKRRIHTIILSSVLGGIGFIIVGLVPENATILAVCVAFFLGFMHPLLNGSLMAMFQAIVPPDIQGRVFTLMISATGITAPLGLAIAGPVGDAWGVHIWFILSGIVTVLMGLSQLFIPAVMQIEKKTSADTGEI
jgi:DHA3 family macrolide efflux protein-like MFS transporter